MLPTNSSSLLPGWLIEPCLHIGLPVLLKVLVRHFIVMLHHLARTCAAEGQKQGTQSVGRAGNASGAFTPAIRGEGVQQGCRDPRESMLSVC